MMYAVIKSGTVVNVIEWDGVTTYHPGEGFTLEAYTAPTNDNPPAVPACPPTILRSQGLQQLNADGKLSAYVTALASADQLTQLLAQSPTWERADARLAALASALGYSDAKAVDAFFNAASKL